ncbi:MAG: 30S ribosomal protein S2 [Candidatus Marinimicrobia bacterium]|nr:30S ribosomal protein S2 [Candidatus Neomarinimicrobiota bacterium]
MTGINFEDLLSIGAHFGHVTRKWNPKFKPFILMEKNGIHIINLDETVHQFEKAAAFIKGIVDRSGEVLFVGTKKQAREIVQQEADRCGMFYVVERWLGGTLTNFMTIKKSIKRLHMLEKEGSSIYENLTKKEIQMLNRERIKLADQHRGIKDMKRLPDALIVVDSNFESTAVAEARRLEIPVVGMVDTNSDPTQIDYPIPANDDSIRTIQLIMASVAEVIIDARKEKIQAANEAKQAAEAARAEQAKQLEQAKLAEQAKQAEKSAKTVVPEVEEKPDKKLDELVEKPAKSEPEQEAKPVKALEKSPEAAKEKPVKKLDKVVDKPAKSEPEQETKPVQAPKKSPESAKEKLKKVTKSATKKPLLPKKPTAKKPATKTAAKKTVKAKTAAKPDKAVKKAKPAPKTKQPAEEKTPASKVKE